jgi:putative transposase
VTFSATPSYDRLTDDGLTQWHPAFLSLGKSLDECAAKYRGFCKKYKPQSKKIPNRSSWGSKKLPFLNTVKPKNKKQSPGQLTLLWVDKERTTNNEINEIAEKFVTANRSLDCGKLQINA